MTRRAAATATASGSNAAGPAPTPDATRRRLRRVFLDGFQALDVAEPLVSYDAELSAPGVRAAMHARGFDLAGVRVDGLVRGYVCCEDLTHGRCGDHLRPFGADDVVGDDASLRDVIQSLGVNGRCFVTVLDQAAAIVTLDDLEKPPVRMFLFGMITILEMLLVRHVSEAFPGETWAEHVAPGRLAKAREVQRERERRGHPCRLLDCLQFSDKGQLALQLDAVATRLEPELSRKELKRRFKDLEQLRNNLAHGQEIIGTSWERIVAFTTRLDNLLASF